MNPHSTWRFDEEESWQKQGTPVPRLTLDHTGCTSFSSALPASLLFNTVSFVTYQMQTSTYCPHICCGSRGSLPRWYSGCCPILSWINTRAICRLADTEMFASLSNAKVTRKRRGWRAQLRDSLWSYSLQSCLTGAVTWMTGVGRLRRKKEEKMSNFRGHYIKGIISNRWNRWLITIITNPIRKLRHRLK